MRRMQAAIVVLAIGAVVADASAQETRYTPWRKIASVSEDARGAVVTLQGAKILSESSCANKFRMLSGGPTAAKIIGAVRNAAAGGKEVRLRHSLDTNECEVEFSDFETRTAPQ